MFLHMFPLWGNGSGSWLRHLALHLAKRGHTVAIVAPEKRKLPGIIHYNVNVPQMGIFVGNPELKGAKKYEEMRGTEIGEIYTSYVNTTLKAVREFEPEIMHVFHTAFLPPVARIVKVLYGIKFIITTHGSDLHYLARDQRLVGLINDANQVAQYITANSSFTRHWYLDMFGYDLSRKTRTILGGVDIDEFNKDYSKEMAKIDSKFKMSGKKMVLFTGRLTKHKGVDILIKAARSIQAEVFILGDGPEKSHLEKLVKDLKLSNVRILGYMKPDNEIGFRAFYKRCDVFVTPSTWNEPFGLVILEAMAAKKPVVATRTGGIASIVKDGVNGYLIKARNSKALAEKVNLLLGNDELRKKMGQKAYETVRDRFTWEKMATQFEDIYKKFKYTTKQYLSIVKQRQ